MHPVLSLPSSPVAPGPPAPLQVSIEPVMPPPRPSTVPQALQQTMPLANVLNLIAKPPGSAPPFIPYKPVPRLVPLPGVHTVTVKRPDLIDKVRTEGILGAPPAACLRHMCWPSLAWSGLAAPTKTVLPAASAWPQTCCVTVAAGWLAWPPHAATCRVPPLPR